MPKNGEYIFLCTLVFSSGLASIFLSAILCTEFLPVIALFKDIKIIRKMLLTFQGTCKVIYSHLLGQRDHHLQADISNRVEFAYSYTSIVKAISKCVQ